MTAAGEASTARDGGGRTPVEPSARLSLTDPHVLAHVLGAGKTLDEGELVALLTGRFDVLGFMLRRVPALELEWGLSADETMRLTGAPSAEAFTEWMRVARELQPHTIEPGAQYTLFARLATLHAISRGLTTRFGSPDATTRWLRNPNPAPPFSGHAPLELMLRSGLSAIECVRVHVDELQTE